MGKYGNSMIHHVKEIEKRGQKEKLGKGQM